MFGFIAESHRTSNGVQCTNKKEANSIDTSRQINLFSNAANSNPV